MVGLDDIITHILFFRNGGGGGGGGSDVSLADVEAFVADFSDKTSYTILNGAYHGTKRAIVS